MTCSAHQGGAGDPGGRSGPVVMRDKVDRASGLLSVGGVDFRQEGEDRCGCDERKAMACRTIS